MVLCEEKWKWEQLNAEHGILLVWHCAFIIKHSTSSRTYFTLSDQRNSRRFLIVTTSWAPARHKWKTARALSSTQILIFLNICSSVTSTLFRELMLKLQWGTIIHDVFDLKRPTFVTFVNELWNFLINNRFSGWLLGRVQYWRI